MKRIPLRIARDHYDDQWSVYEERPTEHGWPLIMGRPYPPRYASGGDATILTSELVEYLMSMRHERGAISLPIGLTAIKRIRKALGLNSYDDMRQWWEEHADELASMTEVEFADKHGYSPARVSQANKALFGKRLREPGWWLVEPARSAIKGDGPRAQVAMDLGISIGAVGRLRWRIRTMDAGLPVIESCEGCGQCCRNQPYPPFTYPFDDGDDRAPEPHLSQIRESVLAGARSDDAPCLWLGSDGKCMHYAIRPEICRDFEMGGEACRRIRIETGVDQ